VEDGEVEFHNCKFDNNSNFFAFGQSKVLLEGCNWNDGALQVFAILSILITDTTFTVSEDLFGLSVLMEKRAV